MATEKGIVTRVDAGMAWVTTKRTEACEGCAARGGCHTLGGGKEMSVEAINSVKAKAGDLVVISFETASLVKLSLLIYVFPIICMIVGAVIGQETAPKYHMDESALAALLGFAFFFVAFFIIRLVSKRFSDNEDYRARVVRITGHQDDAEGEACAVGAPDGARK